jgi:hypothetical protein
MTPAEARDICDLLRAEANDLAALVDENAFEKFPSRVDFAVQREMQRLRHLADVVKPFTVPAYTEPIIS